MSTPSSTPLPPRPRRVVTPPPKEGRREMLMAVGVGTVILALVIAGILGLSREPNKPSRNFLSGTIVAKHATGERTEEIQVGRKGVKSQETDSGYAFEIKVEATGRVYEVGVRKELYDKKKVGEKQDFIRPPSEQTY